MEGDRLIRLLEPGNDVQDEYGQMVQGPPISHERYAIRKDRRGLEGVKADTQVGEWDTRFEIRYIGLEALTQKWEIIDEYSREYDIESVREAPIGRRQ